MSSAFIRCFVVACAVDAAGSGCGGGQADSMDMPPGASDAAPDTGHGTTRDAGGTGDAASPPNDATTTASPGCGKAPLHKAGGVQVTLDAGPTGDGMRGFYLSLPANYDSRIPHKLIVGYPGTNWVGKQIQPYLDLEAGARPDEIFVYPDPLWHDFKGWGNLGGWLLGPNAAPANGDQDLIFTGKLLDYMQDNYCIDSARVFATGHSWGGDMAEVVSCFLGDRFRASVPVAANRPYWFEPAGGGASTCRGSTAVWTFFGIGDDHFTWQKYPGEFGDQCRDFWLRAHQCTGKDANTDIGLGAMGECLEYTGCAVNTRYCLYGPKTGHQRPDYYPMAAMNYFRSF